MVEETDGSPLRFRGVSDDEAAGILDLPDEMIRKIGQYLTLEDLKSFRSTHPNFLTIITMRDVNASRNARITELLSYQNAFTHKEIELLKMSRFTPRHESILVRRMRLENQMIDNPHVFNDKEAKYLMKCIYKGYQNNYKLDQVTLALEVIRRERTYIYGENVYLFPYDGVLY